MASGGREQLHQKPTLAQALEKFSDPDLLASFDAAEADCGKWIRRRFGEEDIFLGPKPRGYQRRIEKWSIARKRIFDEFINKLRTGQLLCFGTPYPVLLDSEPVQIPSARWRFLNPRFASDESIAVEGGRCHFVRIWVEPCAEKGEGQEPAGTETQITGTRTTRAEAAERACEEWLKRLQRRPENKDTAFDGAVTAVTNIGPLSRKGFDRAWAGNVPADWKKAGARKGPRKSRPQ